MCLGLHERRHGFKPAEMIKGGIPTYFLAKGLFCSAALFLVGRIVSLLGENDAK